MDLVTSGVLAALALSLLMNGIQAATAQRRRLGRLEREMRYLFDAIGIAYDPVAMMTPALREAVAEGRTIEAILLYRETTGASARDAKNAVDRIASQ